MRIERIECGGWMPFADEFALDLPAGPIAIVGMHEGNPRRSNRAGKTSLLRAITWCNYGVHHKRLDDLVIHNGSGRAYVTLFYPGMIVRRSRERGHGTKLQVECAGGETLLGELAQDKIVEALGFTLADSRATLVFEQGDIESIIARPAGKRLELAREWLQLTKWAVAKKIQLGKVTAVSAALAAKRASVKTLEEAILKPGPRRTIVSDIAKYETELRGLQAELETLQSRAGETEHARAFLEAQDEIASLRVRATTLREALKGKQAADREAQAAESALQTALQDETAVCRKMSDTARIAASGFDGECPVMCRACPAAAAVEGAVRTNIDLLANYQIEHRALVAASDQVRRKHLAARGVITEMDRRAAQYTEVTERGKELREKFNSGLTEEAAREMIEQAAPADDKLHTIAQTLADVAHRIGSLKQELATSDDSDKRCKALREQVLVVEDSARAQALALRAIASVPAEIARVELLALEESANLLLTGLGVSFRFSWERELGEKAPSCEMCGHVFGTQRGDTCPKCEAARGKKLSEELEILVSDGSGLEEDARFNSGGTQAIVGASLRLAASAMLRRIRSAAAAFAIVDEPFASLDTDNREALARAFAAMLGSVGLEQAFVVSHDAALLAALPNRIVIDKCSGASRVRME